MSYDGPPISGGDGVYHHERPGHVHHLDPVRRAGLGLGLTGDTR
jgi:hypothetical protein